MDTYTIKTNTGEILEVEADCFECEEKIVRFFRGSNMDAELIAAVSSWSTVGIKPAASVQT